MIAASSPLLAAHNVRIVGAGHQYVVLSHGFGSDQSVWKYILPYLLNDYKVILYDMMGAGSTNPQDFSFKRYSSLHAYADDLLAILDELEIESCVFVGASVSGMIGVLASIERPEVFRKLVLLGSSPRYLNDPSYYGGFEQHDLDQLHGDMKSNFKSWVAGFGPLCVGADLESRAVQEFSATIYSMRPDIALNVSKTIFESDLRPTLPLVTVPVHILQTRKDMAVPFEVANYLLQNLGGWTTMEVLNTEGHLPHLSDPNVVIPVLLRCLPC
jgi:pimeloyl-ACP methyl ester carboxylesterase